MHVVVCVKQVPDTTNVRINPETNTLMREGVESIMNPFDEYALEQALALKDFLQKRYDWIDESIHMDDFNRHAATYTLYDYHPQNAGNADDVPPALPDADVVPMPDAGVVPVPDAGVVPMPDAGMVPMPETVPEAVPVE